MQTLTLQIYSNLQWHDAATLEIHDVAAGRASPCALGYEQNYAIEHMYKFCSDACSLQLPVEIIQQYQKPHWFSFLEDIMPAGAGRRFWVEKLAIGNLPAREQDLQLLKYGSIAPVGNARIKEAVASLTQENSKQYFSTQDVIDRNADFLEYAQERGAAGGGATGAGGEAPKLLIRKTGDNNVWIDSHQETVLSTDPHYLVKFPRGKKSPIDNDILRAEYHYYQELSSLGFSTIETSQMQLHEGDHYPSLWLPRFDICCLDSGIQRYGLESVYSALGMPAAARLNHLDTIQYLIKLIRRRQKDRKEAYFDEQRFVEDWVVRDLLNLSMGNSDNHGRNTSFIKGESTIELAPIYDFAPMKADPEGITRSTKWPADLEQGGQIHWKEICTRLDEYLDPMELFAKLEQTAAKLVGVADRLEERGTPDSILSMPAVGLRHLDDKLRRWGLL